MKKTFLLTAALAATCSAFAATPSLQKADINSFKIGPKAPAVTSKALTRADGAMESFDFTYAGEPANGYSLNGATGGKTRVFLAFEMATEDIKTFAGSKVSGFTVVSPFDANFSSNSITDARFFCTTDLSKEEFTQDFTMSKSAAAYNDISLDEAYTITGEEEALYFGYSFVVPKKNDMYYLLVDAMPNDPNTGIYGMTDEENAVPEEYYSFADEIGALCMSITLERENLPKFVSFASFPSSICLPLGEASTLPITLKATSGSPIESVEIEYTLGGQVQNSTIVLDPAISAGAGRYFGANLEFPACNEKFNETVLFKLTKINGIDNEGENTTAEADVVVVSEVPVHQTLYEEYTGTWCGYCTRGYAALEYIRENYPEFVVAAFHSGNGSKKDPMQITDEFPSAVSGFPSAVLNRSSVVDPYYGSQTYDMQLPIVGDILALNAIPTVWSVKVAHAWESDDVLIAKAEVANMAGFKDKNYRIVYLLVADGLSGANRSWYQTNYYNTDSPSDSYIPQLNEFCKGGEYGKSSVKLTFNDVVISDTGIYGEEGSIPTSLEAEQVAEHTISFDLTNIPADLLPDKNKLRVIAAVVDARGTVLNCAKDEVNDYQGAAVESISDVNAPVEFYNLNGQKVANPSNGIFLRRQGSTTQKVIIK